MDCSNLRFETERLALVSMDARFREEHFANFSADVATYMYPRPAKNISETDATIADEIVRNKAGVDWMAVVTLRETGEFLGCAVLIGLRNGTPELGIWIKQSAQGKGYGLEAVGGLIAWARENLTFEYLKYPVDRRNIASSRIPEHFGGTIHKEYRQLNQSGVELDLVEYRIV